MLFLFFLFAFYFLNPQSIFAEGKNVSISAQIGSKANIYGYSAPNAKVELVATNAYASTYSNKFGYWQFKKIYLPPIASEICFHLTDDQNLTAPPTCIPSPPTNDFTSNIGPIVLPPTIAINSAIITPNSTIASSGQSVPNTLIKINFFTQRQNSTFPKTADAYSLPALEIMTNKAGFYDFNLPTAYSTSYKFFASTHHPDLSPSPKSHTLSLSLPSFWQLYNSIIISILLFFITLGSLVCLIFKNRHPQAKQSSALALYPKTLAITSCPVK